MPEGQPRWPQRQGLSFALAMAAVALFLLFMFLGREP
jgi:hypothetical protein